MKRVMVDCNTCNTEYFGFDTPPVTLMSMVSQKGIT